MARERCGCRTAKGTKCTRKPVPGSKYCWQHTRNCKTPYTLKVLGKNVKSMKIEIPNRDASIKRSFEVLCNIYKDIALKKNEIGKGSYGSVYRYCVLFDEKGKKVCDYAIKIQKGCTEYDYLNILKSMKVNNQLHEKGLAPKIYGVKKCGRVCVSLMDYVRGRTLFKMITSGQFDMNKAKLYIKSIRDMHKVLKHGHGDIGPSNLMFSKSGAAVWIDPGPEDTKRPAAYDFGVLLWYIPDIVPFASAQVISYLYRVAYDELDKNLSKGDRNRRFLGTILEILDYYKKIMNGATLSRRDRSVLGMKVQTLKTTAGKVFNNS